MRVDDENVSPSPMLMIYVYVFIKIGDDLMMLMFYEGLFYLVRDMITL